MVVHEIRDSAGFSAAMQSAKNKLVVVDFFATWCGPCKVISPIFTEWSNKYDSTVVFLKVDVDIVKDVAQSAGVKQLPSFGFYHQGKLLELQVGGDPKSLEAKIKDLGQKFGKSVFDGTGNSLTGPSSAAAAGGASKPTAAAAASKPAAGGSGRKNPWADASFVEAKLSKNNATAESKPAAAATKPVAASSTSTATKPVAATPAPKPAAATPTPAAAKPTPAPTPAAAPVKPAAAPTPAVAPPSDSARAAAAAAAEKRMAAAPKAEAPAATPAAASSTPAATPAASASSTPAAAAASSAPVDAAAASSTPAAASAASSTPAPAASSSAPPQNDPSLTKQLNPGFLNTLVNDMGFSRLRAEKGLIMTQNKSVDQALNWLMEHDGDADIDEPLQLVGQQAKGPGGINLDDMDEDERVIYENMQKKKIGSSGVAFAGGANTGGPAKVSTLNMTHEEKMEWLAKRRAEVRANKEAAALEEIKEKERSRKKQAAESTKSEELKEQLQRKAADAAIRAKRKEEDDKKRARANALAKIEEDKARRREQQKREMEAIAAQKAAAAAAAAKK